MKQCMLLLVPLLGLVSGRNVSLPLEQGQVGDRMVIVDSTGARIKLACVNWYGAHMEDMVVNGLDRQHVDFISAKIVDLGFNCIRLPFALDTYYKNPVIKESRLSANPELVGMTAMEVFDRTVKSLTDHGLIVILNNHISTAMWCCSSNDGEGLWYTNEYPVEMFNECLVELAARYRDNPLVAGMDLRNEIRPAHGVLATWGTGAKVNDWAEAAEVVGNMILEVNPDMLIFVEGILSAGNLIGALVKKVELTNPKKLVYSGHIYPFSPIISDLPYGLFKTTMHTMQTFVADAGFNYSAPYWMGEFGTGENSEKWQHIIQFLQETDHDWGYWSIDGYKYPDYPEWFGVLDTDYATVHNAEYKTRKAFLAYPNGILDEDYATVKDPWKLEQLQSIMPILSDHEPAL